MKENYLLTFNGKYYKLNLVQINNFCLNARGDNSEENEITEAYEADDNGEFNMTSRINREVKTKGNSQENMIVYDFVKTLIGKIVDGSLQSQATEAQTEVGFALVFNTLLAHGMLEEITE